MRSSFSAWRVGWRLVGAAPAILAGAFALTFVLALPLAIAMRGLLEAHLGASMAAAAAADGVNYDWWQEFSAQASGLASTFTPAVIGFAATLDNISSLAERQREIAPVAGAVALYLAGWTFLVGGILDRYARTRGTHAFGFFGSCGVFFWRFLRLAAVAGVFYWWAFSYVHPWLFSERYPALTRDMSVERDVFLVRAGMYAAFGALLILGNLVFDFAKVRAVVEDRRSMLAAIAAALRFIGRHPRQTFGLAALNGLTFLVLLAAWALVAPGAGGPGASVPLGFALAQLYVLARLALKLHGLASQTALFQTTLAHAAYIAVPARPRPEPAAAESLG